MAGSIGVAHFHRSCKGLHSRVQEAIQRLDLGEMRFHQSIAFASGARAAAGAPGGSV